MFKVCQIKVNQSYDFKPTISGQLSTILGFQMKTSVNKYRNIFF